MMVEFKASPFDIKFMGRAFELAHQALAKDEVPIGCVFVYNDIEIGHGMNDVNATKNPTRHAEMVAFDIAADWCKSNDHQLMNVLKESTLYVTLEPCIMCANAMQKLNLKRIMYGAKNDRFGGLGGVLDVQNFESHKFDISQGFRKDDAINLLKDFYKRGNPFAPEPKRKS